MLFTYQYPIGHNLELLNNYFFDFLTAIRTVRPNTQFRPQSFLHPDFLAIVNRSPKLEPKLRRFFSSFKVLPQHDKDRFYNLVIKSQDIQSFFLDENIICADTMSLAINNLIGNNSLSTLVSHLFKITLKGLGIHNHYKLIYDAMPFKVCPFCGVEIMHKSFQEDYDHLAAKKHYPIVGIHMRNLAPMCHTCNSKNKGESDVLHDEQNVRRLFVYPYSQSVDVTIDFSNCIIPQTDAANYDGSWEIQLIPNDTITATWDAIFNIKKRYREDYLEAKYEDWLEDFLDDLKFAGINLNNNQDVINHLMDWSDILMQRKFHNINFIKAPLFSYLANCGIDAFYTSIIRRYNQKLAA